MRGHFVYLKELDIIALSRVYMYEQLSIRPVLHKSIHFLVMMIQRWTNDPSLKAQDLRLSSHL